MPRATFAPGWECLVGTPWEGLDCRDVVRAVYRLSGIELPAQALTQADAGLWEKVPRPTRVLDVIASDPHGAGCESHLSVMVRVLPRRLALSSFVVGGVATTRAWAVQSVLGVYRLRAL